MGWRFLNRSCSRFEDQELTLIGTPPAQPSPGGRGGRSRCLKRYVDLKDRVDYEISTKPLSIMDSVRDVQVGVLRESPPISPLSLRERARVRGF
jgi:hypothetical protein